MRFVVFQLYRVVRFSPGAGQPVNVARGQVGALSVQPAPGGLHSSQPSTRLMHADAARGLAQGREWPELGATQMACQTATVYRALATTYRAGATQSRTRATARDRPYYTPAGVRRSCIVALPPRPRHPYEYPTQSP